MLRFYKPLKNHEIFRLHEMLEHLVCNVWCEANGDVCSSKIHPDFKDIYDNYDWLKTKIDTIYEACKSLSVDERETIVNAFFTNNQIEKLCNGDLLPVHLNKLPGVVEQQMKPLLIDFYEILLERKKVPGTKQDYYQKLIRENEFQYCPCCGYMTFESTDCKYREAFDHYLPKSDYPFASVNFSNLVPLCYKCNSDRKKVKDPIEKKAKAFYPFSNEEHRIEINITIDKAKDLRKLDRSDLAIDIIGDMDKIATWDRLFDIKERYNDITRSFTKTFLQRIKRRHKDFSKGKENWSYTDSLNKIIEDYEYDRFEDCKFLKIPLMQELKNCASLIEVYGD